MCGNYILNVFVLFILYNIYIFNKAFRERVRKWQLCRVAIEIDVSIYHGSIFLNLNSIFIFYHTFFDFKY